MTTHATLTAADFSAHQRSIRNHASRLRLRDAVRLAADDLFRFTHCATRGKALWSDSVRVWLGHATFLNWAISDSTVNIPRIVAKADGAPESPDKLHAAVRHELMDYWADRLDSLPPKSTPGWLPLP